MFIAGSRGTSGISRFAPYDYPVGSGSVYHGQLAALIERLEEMCGLAVSAMDRATQALLRADLVLAERVITDGEQITTLAGCAEEHAFAVLALRAPVAGDLRTVVSSVQMAADIGRMGGLAVRVAKMVRRRHPQHAIPAEVGGCFAQMGRIATELGCSAAEVLRSRDAGRAAGIRREDDAMDGLLRHLFTVVVDGKWRHGVVAAVDVTLLGRFYERFADHAVEVARGVVFQATGRLAGGQNRWLAVAAASGYRTPY